MADRVQAKVLDKVLNIDNADGDIRELLQDIRPQWQGHRISIKQLPGGPLNTMYHCHLEGESDEEDGLVIRCFPDFTAELVSRDRELLGMEWAYQAGCGVPVYAVFGNGFVMGFAAGRQVTYEDFMTPPFNKLVARSIAMLHHTDPQDIATIGLTGSTIQVEKLDPWAAVFKIFQGVPDKLADPDKQNRMESEMLSKAEMRTEIEEMEELLKPLNMPVVFSHHDCHHRNAIYNPHKELVYLVDYELCAYNFEAIDVIFYFALLPYWSSLGICTKEESSKAVPDETVREFVRAYVESSYELQGKASSDVTDEDVDRMMVMCRICEVALHFMFMMAQLLQAENPDAKFDALELAIMAGKKYSSAKKNLPSLIEEYKRLLD